jgi:two-component system response regulator FlrC
MKIGGRANVNGADVNPARAQPDLGARMQPKSGIAPVAASHRVTLVGRTIADVERDLILDTLDHCLGNRTHAARILGISLRTMRNRLNDYAMAGVAVPPPGEARAVAT